MEEPALDPDQELVRAAQTAREGDLRAFEELVLRHQRRVVTNCKYLTHGGGEAEDLAQEVFVKAFFGIGKFEGRSTFQHWVQRIKVNHCLNHLKKQERERGIRLDPDSAETIEQLQVAPVGQERLEAAGRQGRIEAILRGLSPALRVPLVMRDMDELSYEEIAASLGIGLSAVKMRIKRARELFRAAYQGSENQPQGRTS